MMSGEGYGRPHPAISKGKSRTLRVTSHKVRTLSSGTVEDYKARRMRRPDALHNPISKPETTSLLRRRAPLMLLAPRF